MNNHRFLRVVVVLVLLSLLSAPQAQSQAIRCQNGVAGDYTCDDLHLLSLLSLADLGVTEPGVSGNDHWGWSDPLTDLQVVVFGLTNGTAFVDITDPENPILLGTLPSHDGVSNWRDIKVFKNVAYIVADVPTNHGMQLFNLTQLRHVASPPVVFSETAHYDGFGPGHNLWINDDSGFLYAFRTDTCNAGIHMLDINQPLTPVFAGCLLEADAPLSDGQCLIYEGPDADYLGRELCFVGSDDNVAIVDVTNKVTPTTVADFTYTGLQRAHQGSLTADHRYWLLSDTMDEMESGHPTRTHIFDLLDLDAPSVLGFHEHATSSRDHNLYVVGQNAIQANFKAGLRILDTGELPSTILNEVAFFDVDPSSDSVATSGAWTAYPWWRDETVSVSSTDGGLFMLGRSLAVEAGTFLGGDLADRGHSVVTDDAGYIYVAGMTQSPSFPEGAPARADRHGVDAFVAKFDPEGAVVFVIWVNAVAAFAEDEAFGIATDGAGSAYVVGRTNSDDFCNFLGVVPGADTTYNGNGDAFVFKINADGSAVDYCTFLGGNDWDTGRAIGVDSAGEATVTGATWSTDFPTTTGAFSEDLIGSRDAFVARLNAAGTALSYSTYIGGTGQDEARGISLDAQGAAFITGWTASDDLPTTINSAFPDSAGGFDAFVASLNPSGSALRYLTYLGGSGEDRGTALAVDRMGRVIVTGNTTSIDFPTTVNSYAINNSGANDGFVATLHADGSQVHHSTYLGGSNEDWIRGITLAPQGGVLLTGETWSSDLPTTTQAQQTERPGEHSGFVLQLDANLGLLKYGSYVGGSGWDTGNAVAMFDGETVVITGATNSSDFPVTDGAPDPDHNGDLDVFVARLRIATDTVANGQRIFVDDFDIGDTSAWSE